MVSENYYQEGQNINQRIKQDQHASDLLLQANLLFSEQTNKINVYLAGEKIPSGTLVLTISAPNNQHLDRTYTLQSINQNLFSAALKEPPKGRFYISLEPQNRQWRLLGSTTLPRQETLVLTSQANSQRLIEPQPDIEPQRATLPNNG